MSVPRFALALLSTLCLAACAAGPSGDALGRRPAPASGAESASPLASMPAAAGRVVGVRHLPYANGLGQEIVLEGPRAMTGENLITVRALTTSRTGGRGTAGEELRLGPASDTEIAAEMERQLPGVAMTIAATPERDAQGAIGYAVGRAGRLACVYAWQDLASARPVSLVEGVFDTGALPVSVRVRLCREQPVAALVADLRGLRVARPGEVGDRPGLLPTGDALEAALGTAGAPPETERLGKVRTGRDTLVPARHARLRGPSPLPRRVRRAGRPRPFARPTGIHRPTGRQVAAVPPLPMPGDVASPAPTAARTLPPDGGDLPMPR